MLEPEPDPTTSDREVEPLLVATTSATDLNKAIIAERNKEVKQIEEDLVHMSAAQRMLAKIVSEQGQQIDQVASNTEKSSNMLSVANEALAESEKSANSRRKRNIVIGVVGGVVGLAVVGGTTVSVLKTLNKF